MVGEVHRLAGRHPAAQHGADQANQEGHRGRQCVVTNGGRHVGVGQRRSLRRWSRCRHTSRPGGRRPQGRRGWAASGSSPARRWRRGGWPARTGLGRRSGRDPAAGHIAEEGAADREDGPMRCSFFQSTYWAASLAPRAKPPSPMRRPRASAISARTPDSAPRDRPDDPLRILPLQHGIPFPMRAAPAGSRPADASFDRRSNTGQIDHACGDVGHQPDGLAPASSATGIGCKQSFGFTTETRKALKRSPNRRHAIIYRYHRVHVTVHSRLIPLRVGSTATLRHARTHAVLAKLASVPSFAS